jgi:transposase
MVGAAFRRVVCPQKVCDSMARHSYSLEFKDEACRLVMSKKQTLAQTAKMLNVPATALFYWLKKRGYQMTVPRELPSTSTDPVAAARIKELEAKLRRTEMERDILKKATAYFAAESLNDSPLSTTTENDGKSQ